MSNNNDKQYTTQELNAMSNEDLARLGTELDDVTIAYRKERFPIANDPAEKRAARAVTFWLVLGIIGGLGFLATYIFWPWEYKAHGDEGLLAYTLYTPMLGITSGLCILSLGFAVVLYVKKFIPEEIAVQRRHDGPSEEVDRRTIVALLNDSWQTSTLGRRKLIMGLAGGGAVLAGLTIIAPMGGMIKNPWNPKEGPMDVQGDGTLWTSGWTLVENDVKVYLGRDTAAIAESHTDATGEHWSTTGVSRLVRMRPEDLAAASMETVFPLPAEMVNDGAEYDPAKDVYEHQMHSVHGPRNAVMLIRLRTADAEKVIEREGQESFHYGDYYAYSKICTHIGCPTSLYEAQTNRILCPCHQSQFDALHYGKPVFGPAARALPQLPITVDEEGYLIAAGNFIEPLGPAFWERKS
ncbi:Rieske iron-sulfur protein [Corynebacterium glutamicum MB001]|uniref:Cytochrome bc1 complex Rieske iron-sulfur subunit n=1 Tax=Corynebacterium glutamicum (strain ATCC 13032 / DSM 20300 / JCM 1318 / BCRC 11384 / CCUG 27702 / LMG 3730 / NBRC 12168 / NCIMB 10025 / NRRL B-2784 / 534) TaxID=196627 RepID=QCRA_CORGL|nr:ubiquinol-cytochrome c reductase iron-sulfur subunit [Corynebacterium glutamicum]Q79VE8.1 RecName: Full=Cytochrome bc1 complex Rieske iron-sulfur subunit; AltName: Full=Cytochrome bc1 reductase complex subunit QcrA; AltName: Full=Menaquinol--cytochrome c reductase iron-sulfur subunit; AltName: Full=Rieske iron-sulfur protein [Corynebacterium glutamicum ATCC 13032]7Q21_A Chain A, Cytochrome bc1 complex Rieske iron-sulfur subunit [Corynebacterium glutamicum ATCC 13032]7Q21_a Chain a, Cytochrome